MDTSDEATGLPPLEELNEDETMIVATWASGEGLVAGIEGTPVVCRFLHLRGASNDSFGLPRWTQVHIAVPIESAMEVAVALMGGPIENT